MPAATAKPSRRDSLFQSGLQLQQQGRHQEAADVFARILASDRSHVPSIYNLGCSLKDAGQPAAALPHLLRAAQALPGSPEVWFNLGVTQGLLGDRPASIRAMRNGLRLRPQVPDAWAALAMMLKAEELHDEALDAIRQATTAAKPRLDALSTLINMELEAGHLDLAAAALDRTVALHGPSTELTILRARLLEAQKRSPEAVALLETVVPDHPAAIDAQYHRARLLLKTERHAQGLALLEAMVRIWPERADVRQLLAPELAKAGLTRQAEPHYQWQLEHCPSSTAALVHATMLPIVPESTADIAYWRQRMDWHLDALFDHPAVRQAKLPANIATTNFYLAYHDLPDRALQEKTARLYSTGCPALNFVAPHCRPSSPRPEGRRLRVAFISEFLRYHTIGKLNRGYIQHLDRNRFEVFDIFLGDPKNQSAADIGAHADHYLALRDLPLPKLQQALADLRLDVAFFTDIGMGNLTYRLAYSRLAPVQCVTWGHPDTTGLPTLDYFLSSEDLETPVSDADYTERLVRMRRVNTFYQPPEVPLLAPTRADFGMDPAWHVYSIPQSLFKMHPDFDPVLAGILERDPLARIVIISDTHQHLQRRLEARFATSLGAHAGRVHFTPRLNLNGFLGLAGVSDVVLDVPQFSGGNTTYESFAMGAPIVTRPSSFMRGRLTAAIYHMMGLGDLVCSSDQDYIDTAVRLGMDRDFRLSWTRRIEANRHLLYHDAQALHELEDFFESAVNSL